MQYFFSIFFGTFVLEDLALASAFALIAENKMSFASAFLACFLGISIGDFGLYLIGRFASRFQLEKRIGFLRRYRANLADMKYSQVFTTSIFLCRFIPGTRLPTYLSAGFLRYSFMKFVFITFSSVFLWVAGALWAGRTLNYIFMDRWILSALCMLFMLHILKSLAPKLGDYWQRRALLYSWRKWQTFEFWPAWFFYLPIVPYYIYLSLRFRSLFMPFYASPHLNHGGLIGESKWDFLVHLNSKDSSTLPSYKISKDLDFEEVRNFLDEKQIEYPFIMKPDVGQRGFGVRIIRNDFDLTEYLLLGDFERIIQRLSLFPREAGVFYVRKPTEEFGRIFSITDKKFPHMIGDGKSRLGDLILADKRARIIAPTYFERMKSELNSIPDKGEKIQISECGNHCQGAIFLNGEKMISPALTKEIDRIAKQLPDFYFGRFDIRYSDEVSLMAGEKFEIVEVNGSGSEATHIWDANTKITDAYRTLFQQWFLLFEIGSMVCKLPNRNPKLHLFSFLRECVKVSFRKDRLAVSS